MIFFNEDWPEHDDRGAIESLLIRRADLHLSGFCHWLGDNPKLWFTFIATCIEVDEKNPVLGFSAVSIARFANDNDIELRSTQNKIPMAYVRSLGQTAIGVYPELEETLWRGEYFRLPLVEYVPHAFEDVTLGRDEWIKLVHDDPCNGPEYKVFEDSSQIAEWNLVP